MQTLYNCNYFNQNTNLNLTCKKDKKRCVLLSESNYCQYYAEEMIKLSEKMGVYR